MRPVPGPDASEGLDDAGGEREKASPFFRAHAAAYATSASHASGSDLTALLAALDLHAGQHAADIATGTWHTAMALAERGLEVVGLDPTPEMLAEARRLALGRGLEPYLRWVCAAVEAMPLPPGAFDVVTCRRAAHHFADVGAAVAAMARLLVPRGRLGLSDMCPERDLAPAVNELERLRDPTHRLALTEEEWRVALEGAGLRVEAWQLLEERITLEAWLSPVSAAGTEAAAIRAALGRLPEDVRVSLTGGQPAGWVKRRLVAVALRP